MSVWLSDLWKTPSLLFNAPPSAPQEKGYLQTKDKVSELAEKYICEIALGFSLLFLLWSAPCLLLVGTLAGAYLYGYLQPDQDLHSPNMKIATVSSATLALVASVGSLTRMTLGLLAGPFPFLITLFGSLGIGASAYRAWIHLTRQNTL